MPSSVPTGNAGTLDLQVWLKDQDVAANTSTVYWQLVLSSSYRNTFQNTPKGWSVNIGGVPFSGTFTFNFNNYTSVVIAGLATATLAHNADGTLTTTVSAHIDATGTSSIGGPTDLSAPITLPPIARSSTPSLSGNPADAGSSVTIYTNRASTGFTHTLEYYIGAASGTIATGVTDSYAWTIPTSVMDQMPSTTSGGATIRCHTYNGGTYIGYKDIGITINVPASVVPTFTTVTHSEATTTPAVATLIGAYVIGWTKLNVAITGAAGVYGSTITSYKIEVAGQTISAVSGVTDVLGGTGGTLTLKGTITDSRGRTAVKNVSITVLNYTSPAITASGAIRVTSGNAVDPNGTYFRVGITATTPSLVVGTQKNNLTYTIRMRASNNATAWSSITPAKTATVAATGYSADNVLGTYSIATSYTVRIEITDKLGALAAQEIQVSTGGTLIHLSKTYDGFGVGKYWEQGSIDALAQMYQNNGKAVMNADQSNTIFAALGAGVNLNTLTTTGVYHQATSANATTALNYPIAQAGLLECFGTTYLYHRYTVFGSGGGQVYVRGYYSGAWSAWRKLVFDFDVDTLTAARVCRTLKTSTQYTSASPGQPTSVTWTSDSSGSGMWAAGSPNSIWPNKAGWWRVSANLRIYTQQGSAGYAQVQMNGANSSASESLANDVGGIGTYVQPSDMFKVTSVGNDYFQTVAFATSASAEIWGPNCHMEAEYIGA